MDPMTRNEIFMAAAAGEFSGELPEPVTRPEFYWQKIAQKIDSGSSVSPEQIDAAIEDYLNSHDADIVTEAELAETLEGKAAASHTHDDRYYTEAEMDGQLQTLNTAISGKAAASHTHDDRYYTETEIDNKLSEKSNAGHSHVLSDVTGLESALAGKQNSLTIDSSPTASSTNPVTSGGVYTALSGKADATATQTALAGKQNALTAGANITIET